MTSSSSNARHLLIIGGGNMAQALMGGLIQAKAPSQVQTLTVIEPLEATRKTLGNLQIQAQSRGIVFNLYENLQAASRANDIDWVLLAVKPQQVAEVFDQLPDGLRSLLCGPGSQAHWLSIAAGLGCDKLRAWIGHDQLVRAMPNTPALIQEGITGLYASPTLTPLARQQAESLMAAVGQVVWVADESLMNAITALSGSGPAYVFRFAEALAAAGQSMGLGPEQALALARQTIKGAALLMSSSPDHPSLLRERVTSKGGTTAAALASLEADGFEQVIQKALRAARDRGEEMGR
jgi:pyrroline-5-carboxylate reductase